MRRNIIIIGSVVGVIIVGVVLAFLIKTKQEEIKIYEVMFNSNGGSIVESQKINEGENATKPEDPTKEGFLFVEWKKEGKTFNFNEKIISNIKLDAEWVEETAEVELVTVSFDTKSDYTIPNQVIEKNTNATEPEIPTKKGYTFLGWYYENIKYDFEQEVGTDITLVAKWKKIVTNSNKENNSATSIKNEQSASKEDVNSSNVNTNTSTPINLKTPIITEGGRGIDQNDAMTILLEINSTSGITGIEIYSSTSKEGTYTLEKSVKKEDWNNTTATVHIERGEHKYYKVRTYEKNSAGTFYSSYSNILEFNNS